MNDKRKPRDEGIGSKIRKVIAGVKFLKKEERIIEKEQIMSILPHRGGKLFLDKVTITPKEIIGEWSVTREACEGHEIGGQLMFKGVDCPEMAAQLLGVWLSQQADLYPNLGGTLAFFRKASFKCMGLAVPGDLLKVKIPVIEPNEAEEEEGNPRIETVGTKDRPGRLRQQAIVVNAGIWVGNTKRAVIYFLELGIIDAKKLS